MVRTVASNNSPSLGNAQTNPNNPANWDADEEAGDVLLQSSDGLLFEAHRCILAQASPVFLQTIQAHPRSSSTVAYHTTPIPIAEPAYVLEALLRLIYPLQPPIFEELSELVPVLSASIRYRVPVALSILLQQLVSPHFLDSQPLRVFAIACRFGLAHEARLASRATLRTDILGTSVCEDMKYVSAYDFHRLLLFHRRRAEAAISLLEPHSEIKPASCPQCCRSGSGWSKEQPRWWYEFAKRATMELRLRPLTDVVFSMQFLADCARTGCGSCGMSILNSVRFLETLKDEMDGLPDMLSL